MENRLVYAGAVIAAGGMAQRMQGIDKQRLCVQGVPVLARSILAMGAVEQICEIVVVARPQMFAQIEDWKQRYQLPPFILTAGGATRQQSVLAGVKALSDRVEYVVIHDGARPFADRELIGRCLQAAVEHGAATAAMPVKDTIKVSAQDGSIEATPDRSRLYLTQTPQIFSMQLYRDAAAPQGVAVGGKLSEYENHDAGGCGDRAGDCRPDRRTEGGKQDGDARGARL